MKHLALIIIAFFILLPVASACSDGEEHAEGSAYSQPIHIVSKDTGDKHPFYVEVAADQETVMRGLMFRSSMDEGHGMLFLFPNEKPRNFWMKNTLIPLDIVYLKADNTIHHIHENAIPHDETPLPSNGPVMNVLEVNGGLTAKLGIKSGDTLVYGGVAEPEAD